MIRLTLFIIINFLLVQTNASIVIEAGKWHKSQLKICLAQSEDYLSEYADIELSQLQHPPEYISADHPAWLETQRVVNLNYTLAKTTAHFAGWQACDRTKSTDVIAYFYTSTTANGKSSLAWSEIARGSKKSQPSPWRYFLKI